jgi:muramoyltetrapeptide carboxypeptidase
MGYKTIHGIMPITYPRATAEAIESLKWLYLGNPTLRNCPDVMNRFGTASGELVGGNLSILYSLLGSTSAIDCTDKILFIEDLDEYLYHIDRMMMNLKRNGCLENKKDCCGSMYKMRDNDIPWGKMPFK